MSVSCIFTFLHGLNYRLVHFNDSTHKRLYFAALPHAPQKRPVSLLWQQWTALQKLDDFKQRGNLPLLTLCKSQSHKANISLWWLETADSKRDTASWDRVVLGKSTPSPQKVQTQQSNNWSTAESMTPTIKAGLQIHQMQWALLLWQQICRWGSSLERCSTSYKRNLSCSNAAKEKKKKSGQTEKISINVCVKWYNLM